MHAVAELAPGRRLLDREAAHVLDVGAGDERLLARAGQHDHADLGVASELAASRSRSSSSVGRSSAFIASGRSIVTVAIAPSRSTTDGQTGTFPRRNSTISLVGAPGVKTAATPWRCSSSASSAGIVPPSDDEHVLRAVLAQPLEDPRDERHVRAGEDRDPDRVGVLLDRGLDDLLRRLVQTGVDDFHPRVTQRTCDDLGAPVVPVETGFCYDDTNLAGHLREYMSVKLTVVGCSPAWPNPGGAQSGYLLEGPGRLLLDCGPGVLAKLREREAWPQVDAIAITHWHLDHWGDLVPWVWGSTLGPGEGVEQPELWVPPEGRELLCSIGGRLGQPEMFEEAFRPERVRRRRALHRGRLRGHRPPRPPLPAARVRLPHLGERDGRRLLRRLGPERRARRDRP